MTNFTGKKQGTKEIVMKDFKGYYATLDGKILKQRENGTLKELRTFKSHFNDHKKRVHIKTVNGRGRCLYVHFLVLIAFQGYKNKFYEAKHKKDVMDNSAGNLYWGLKKGAGFWDILKDDELFKKWTRKIEEIKFVNKAREWSDRALKRYENARRRGLVKTVKQEKEFLRKLFE